MYMYLISNFQPSSCFHFVKIKYLLVAEQMFILQSTCKYSRTFCEWLISFQRELSVMHSLRICCKILCQNLLVHHKCMLGGSTKFHAFHVLPTHPPSPSPEMEISAKGLDFEILKLTFGNWLLPPTYPPLTWEFGILAFLDSASKVDCKTPPPPLTHLPTLDMAIWDFSIFGLSIKSWPPTPQHLPTLDMGIWNFSTFGLSIKSWPPTPPPPHVSSRPIFARFSSCDVYQCSLKYAEW